MSALDAILSSCQTSGWEHFLHAPRTKFNPVKKSLGIRTDNLTFTVGRVEADSPAIIQTKEHSTTQVEINQATAINTFQTLPTLTAYVDIEELHDVEKIETAFYEASKKFTW